MMACRCTLSSPSSCMVYEEVVEHADDCPYPCRQLRQSGSYYICQGKHTPKIDTSRVLESTLGQVGGGKTPAAPYANRDLVLSWQVTVMLVVDRRRCRCL